MKRIEKTFRLTKICKITASVGLCGFLLTFNASAEVLNSSAASQQNVRNEANDTYNGSGQGIDVYYQETDADGGGGIDTHSDAVTMTLANGADLTGLSPTGGAFLAIYSRDVRDLGDSDNTGDYDSFTFSGSTNSLLVLEGNNTIGGDVGYHLSFSGQNGAQVVAYSYGSVDADAIDEIQIDGDVDFNGRVNASRINIRSGAADVRFDDLVDINGADDALGTVVDFNGHNASVILSDDTILNGSIINKGGLSDANSPLGDRTNGSLVFLGDGKVTGAIGDTESGLALIQFDGSSDTVLIGGSVTANQLNYGAASNVTINGDLLMTPDASPAQVLGVTFVDKDGSLNIVGGSLTGIADQVVVSNIVTSRGTLTFTGDSDGNTGSSEQTVTGDIGESDNAIKRLNIGGASSNNHANVTVGGDVFATSVVLLNDNNSNPFDSHLTMSADRQLTGTVTTDVNGMGDLTLSGGTQTVTGTVGADSLSLDTVTSGANDATSTFTGTIYATNVDNSGAGTSNYEDDVTATNVGVLAGTSNFVKGLTATTTTISTGTGNFNTDDTSVTNSAIAFSDAGTANLHTGLTGDIAFAGNDAIVNLWDGQEIAGATTTSTNDTGIINVKGSGTINGTVGASGLAIKQLNLNTDGVNSEALTIAKFDVYADTVRLQSSAYLRLEDGADLGVSSEADDGLITDTNSTGSLVIDGTSNITGNVGSNADGKENDFWLKSIVAGATGDTVTFSNGLVYADTLSYSGNGTIRFNGSSPENVDHEEGVFDEHIDDLGFIGTVDFVDGAGAFELGDNVDLYTQYAYETVEEDEGTVFTNANNAALRFAGSSVVTGDLGSSDNANDENFKEIFAGADNEVVTFRDKVYVAATTFHVSGTGTVNFMGDLNGPLVYDNDGTVNVSDGININGSVATDANNQGTLNFVGSATTQAPIGGDGNGEDGNRLKAVNFHAATSDSTVSPVSVSGESINIGHDVYAVTTTIGNGSAATAATITASGLYLGDNLTLTGTTVLNTAGSVSSTDAISPVNFSHRKNVDGTLTNIGAVTQSNTGDGVTGAITTSGATLNFAIGTSAWADPVGAVEGAGGTVSAAASSGITGASGSTLVMNGSETVNLSLLGSLSNGQSYTLINVADDNDNTSLAATLNDNSYVLTTTLSRSNNNTDTNEDLDGDLTVTVTRANNVYITASDTAGHFSNDAALRLGTLAASGQDYDEDMQTVLNMLDIDQWGYGNNEDNLAVQAQRLAPIANNSFGLSAFHTASLMNDSIGMRMHEMRIPETGTKPEAVWIRSIFQRGDMDAIANNSGVVYDGFETRISGVTLGYDMRPTEGSLLGVAASYSTTEIDQKNFRSGEDASINSVHASLYGAMDLTPEFPELFVDATITGSWNNTEGNRATVVGRTALYDIDSDQLTGKVNLGYRIAMGETGTTVTPLMSYSEGSYDQNAYTETGAGNIGLSVEAQKLKWKQAAVGLRVAGTTLWGGMVAKPEFTLLATKDGGDFARPVIAQYIGDNTAQASFTTQALSEGQYDDDSGVKASLGLALLMSKTSSMNFRYEHSQNDKFKSDQLDMIVRWDF